MVFERRIVETFYHTNIQKLLIYIYFDDTSQIITENFF